MYKQTTKFAWLGAAVCGNADLAAEINRRVLLANLRVGRHSLRLYDQPTVPLQLKVRMLKTKVVEIISLRVSYGAPPWPISPCCGRLTCIGWKIKPLDDYHCFHTQMHRPRLAVKTSKWRCESGEYLSQGSWLVRHERLPKRLMFGEVEGGNGYVGGQKQDWMGCVERDLSLFNLPIEEKQWKLAAKKSDVLKKRQIST